MYDLPLRESEIAIRIPGAAGEGPLCTLWMEPLTDAQWVHLNQSATVTVNEDESVTWRLDLRDAGDLFRDRLRRVEDLAIAGEPFDAGRPEHVESICQRRASWIPLAIIRLYQYGQGLGEADLGNSARPAQRSTTDTTSSPASRPDSSASS